MNREEELMQRKFLKELAAINRNLVDISESLKTIGEAADTLSKVLDPSLAKPSPRIDYVLCRQMDEAKKVIKVTGDDSV